MEQRTCSEDGCDRPVKARGYCWKHYSRWRRHGDPQAGVHLMRRGPECSVQGCEKPQFGRGYCQGHRKRWKKYGDPLGAFARTDDYIWAKVNKDGPVPAHASHLGPCWLWTGYLSKQGYGRISWKRDGKNYRLAHRVTYIILVGEIPVGLTLDHLCRMPACVNPGHCEPVSLAENTRRAAQARAELAALTCPSTGAGDADGRASRPRPRSSPCQ